MKKTAIYLRVSTNDQDKGIKSQEKALRDYAKAHGFDNPRWYKDKQSGATIDRPDFTRLQKDIFDGKVERVICWKLDRLSRSLRDGINTLHDWCKQGIHIVAVSQQIDFNGTIGELMASLLFGLAQMERENLRENTKRGIMAAKARGAKLGKRPGKWVAGIKPLQAQDMSIAQIAAKLGKSRQAIYDAIKRNGQKA